MPNLNFAELIRGSVKAGLVVEKYAFSLHQGKKELLPRG